MSRLLCTCGKSYEVKDRAPGTRVRCRACQAVLTVPVPRMADPVRTASERLRKARGEPCSVHPRVLASEMCERCHSWMCYECRAEAPSSHLCRRCAPQVGATKAIPLDFGALATPFVAAKLVGRALPRVLVFNILAHVVQWALAIPFLAVAYAVGYSIDRTNPTSPELTVFIAAAAAAALVVSLFEVVLIPAADIVLFDRALREGTDEAPPLAFGAVLKAAFRRSWERKGALLLTYFLLLTATLGSLLVLLPFVLAWMLSPSEEVLAAGVLCTMPAIGAVLGSFGLAIPAVVLEHRTAQQAFGRAWNLARLRPWITASFGTVFVFVGAIISYRLRELELSLGFWPAQAIAFFADIAWPALLVAAYHGLVAEEARLVGRRS